MIGSMIWASNTHLLLNFEIKADMDFCYLRDTSNPLAQKLWQQSPK